MANETNRPIDLGKTRKSICSLYGQRLSKCKDKWESYGYKIGKTILVKTLKDAWKGTFLGIAEDGALRVKTSSGETRKLYSAEIDWFKEENKTYVKSPQFTR